MGAVGAGLTEAAKNGQAIIYCNAEKTWLIAKRLQLPCIAYAEHPFMLQSRFDGVVYSGMGQIPETKPGEKPTMRRTGCGVLSNSVMGCGRSSSRISKSPRSSGGL